MLKEKKLGCFAACLSKVQLYIQSDLHESLFLRIPFYKYSDSVAIILFTIKY